MLNTSMHCLTNLFYLLNYVNGIQNSILNFTFEYWNTTQNCIFLNSHLPFLSNSGLILYFKCVPIFRCTSPRKKNGYTQDPNTKRVAENFQHIFLYGGNNIGYEGQLSGIKQIYSVRSVYWLI